MTRTMVLALGVFFLPACSPSERPAPLHPSEVAFSLPERDLFPEGMAYDPISESFFLGSLRKSKILRIQRDGSVDTLAGPDVLGMGGILGMRVDPERRILWANFHQAREQLGASPSGPYRTGIHKVDLASGGLIRSYVVEKEEDDHLFNDVALSRDGTAFITSYSKGTLYRIPADTDELEVWLPMPEGVFTNGIDIGPEERFLFVAGDADIYRVEIDTGEILRLPLPEGGFIGYGDGLYYSSGFLFSIAINVEEEVFHHQVIRLRLSEDFSGIEEIRVLDQDHPLYAFPTTGSLVDGWLYYIATAQFDKVDEEGNVAPWEDLSDILILRLNTEAQLDPTAGNS